MPPRGSRSSQTNTTEHSVLTADILGMLVAALREIGDFGEVHLVVKHGRVHLIRTVQSKKVGPSVAVDGAAQVAAGA
jgi:hypothetical protein